MTDRPILFSAPMVRALMAGTKTQTRRAIKKPAALDALATFGPDFQLLPGNADLLGHAVGDRLYVREAHSLHAAQGQGREDGKRWGPWGGLPTAISPDLTQIAYYRESFDRSGAPRWRPGIHMPRWASRITLTVTKVRVQRLQEISETDAVAEGVDAITIADVPRQAAMSRRSDFRALWDHINGPGAWDSNPWVAAYSFTVRLGNIDKEAVSA